MGEAQRGGQAGGPTTRLQRVKGMEGSERPSLAWQRNIWTRVYDAMRDAAHTARREEAVKWLTEKHGEKAFTDEEVEAEAEELDEAWADYRRLIHNYSD